MNLHFPSSRSIYESCRAIDLLFRLSCCADGRPSGIFIRAFARRQQRHAHHCIGDPAHQECQKVGCPVRADGLQKGSGWSRGR